MVLIFIILKMANFSWVLIICLHHFKQLIIIENKSRWVSLGNYSIPHFVKREMHAQKGGPAQAAQMGRDRAGVQPSSQTPEAKLMLVSLRLPSPSAEPRVACVAPSAQLPAGFRGFNNSA